MNDVSNYTNLNGFYYTPETMKHLEETNDEIMEELSKDSVDKGKLTKLYMQQMLNSIDLYGSSYYNAN